MYQFFGVNILTHFILIMFWGLFENELSVCNPQIAHFAPLQLVDHNKHAPKIILVQL